MRLDTLLGDTLDKCGVPNEEKRRIRHLVACLRKGRVVCALFLLALSGGCLTPSTIAPMRYYTVSPEPSLQKEQPHQKSLGMRPLIAARPYKLEIAYRSGPNQLAYIPNAEWAELPSTAAGRAISDGIVGSQIFTDAGDAMVMARPDFVLTGELRRFEADYTTSPPVFVVAVDGAIRSTPDGVALWQSQIEVQVPLESNLAERGSDSALTDLAQAASEAVSQLSEKVCEEIRQAIIDRPALLAP